MQRITVKGLYFHGTKKELHHFLKHLSNYYTTIMQAIMQEKRKKLH